MRVPMLIAALHLLATAPALAGTSIIGTDPDARACYLAAEAGDTRAGLRLCDSAIEKGFLTLKDLAATHVNRSILLSATKHYDDALQDIERALALSPGLPEAFANRGNIAFARHRFGAAIADYDRAIAGNSDKLFAVYFNRGLVYEALDQPRRAIPDFEKTLALKPDFKPAQEALAFYRHINLAFADPDRFNRTPAALKLVGQ